MLPKAQGQGGLRTPIVLLLSLLGTRESKETLLGIVLTFFLVFTELFRPSLRKVPTLGLHAGFRALAQSRGGNSEAQVPSTRTFTGPKPCLHMTTQRPQEPFAS